jgi:hypothetical protein
MKIKVIILVKNTRNIFNKHIYRLIGTPSHSIQSVDSTENANVIRQIKNVSLDVRRKVSFDLSETKRF